jgi:hypothetical protein
MCCKCLRFKHYCILYLVVYFDVLGPMLKNIFVCNLRIFVIRVFAPGKPFQLIIMLCWQGQEATLE